MTSKELKTLAKELVAEQMRYEAISIDEVSKILGIAPSTVMQRIDQIPHGVYGKRPVFFKGDIVSMIRRDA